jgi:hypothetical protein
MCHSCHADSAIRSAFSRAALGLEDHAQIGPIWRAANSTAEMTARRIESISLSHSYSPFGMLIRRPTILSADDGHEKLMAVTGQFPNVP